KLLQNRGRPEGSPDAAACRCDYKHRYWLFLISTILMIQLFGPLVPSERRFPYGRTSFDSPDGRPTRERRGYFTGFYRAQTDAIKIPQKGGEGREQKKKSER